ncbi:trypsin-like peptidase domain-containing protein [Planctomyces sp. SH-PL62]|uniref:trypsin-like peptidase domain-containing protein n=1 Tax=Planctomyces sp. SH-PL62 TaxID=1636152 RepID=UPI00078B4E8D|nr:trypsin-like peptidase domain-containing protein [Planctomyces sp. SH-PL62]AMV38338.1 Periplasmic serine endoprotease DegP precursor [Planctomyces sp. SH-PL62]
MALLLCLVCVGMAWDDAPAPATAPLDVVSAFEKVLTDAIARTEGAVVAIHRDRDENARETLAVRGRPRAKADVEARMLRARMLDDEAISFDFGSGVVVGDDGEILTCFHVVKGASRLIVRAVDRQAFEAEVIAADPRSDLAVIAPVAGPGLPKPRLKPIPLGDATGLRKGSFLITLGNPFNAAMQDGRANASWGILSNVARRVMYDSEVDSTGRRVVQLPHYPTLLQLDSKLNLGMSGGAVVNLKGELVGLVTTAASPAGFDAMAGYAFPIDRMGRRAVETLKQGKEVEYGLLGIRQSAGFNANMGNSNRIDSVSPNSPAALGDLQRDDVIVAVEGAPVHDFSSLIVAVSAYAPGDKIRLKILREGRELEKTLVLAKFPVEGEIIATVRPPAWRGIRVDHRSLLIAPQVGFNPVDAAPQGVVVREVEPGSPADKAGLKPWQTIREIGGRPVTDPAEFAKVVADVKGPARLMTDLGPITVEP